MTLKVLQFGATGQMARETLLRAPRHGMVLTALPREAADLADPAAIEAIVLAADADLVINAAAYTAVDKAENDVSAAWEAALAKALATPQGERALLSRLRHARRQPWHLNPQLLPAASMRPASACPWKRSAIGSKASARRADRRARSSRSSNRRP